MLERKRVSSLIDCKVSKTIQSLFNNSKAQNSKLIMKLEIETSLETCGGENPRESWISATIQWNKGKLKVTY